MNFFQRSNIDDLGLVEIDLGRCTIFCQLTKKDRNVNKKYN